MGDVFAARPGRLPHVRVVGFEPVPLQFTHDEPRNQVLCSFRENETTSVSSPLSMMLGSAGFGKSGSDHGSPGSCFFAAKSSDSDRSASDVVRRFDNDRTARELIRGGSEEMTSTDVHDERMGEPYGKPRSETPPMDIPYAKGYRGHPRTHREPTQRRREDNY
jgi:hypothetical protein